MNRSALLLIVLLAACRTSAMERGPLRTGDEELAREPIAPASVRAPGSDPPPPPVDTLSTLFLSAPAADDTTGVPGAALRAPTTRRLGIRARYYLREDGKRGWIAFPAALQPTGVTVDSTARIIIRDGRMGGAGTITVRDERGTLAIDLSRHLRGAGSEIRGSCGGARPGRGACATLVFEGVPYTPANGPPRTERIELAIGAPSP